MVPADSSVVAPIISQSDKEPVGGGAAGSRVLVALLLPSAASASLPTSTLTPTTLTPLPPKKQDLTKKKVSDFLHAHSAYELIPESGKVVVLDCDLPVRQAFHALHEQVGVWPGGPGGWGVGSRGCLVGPAGGCQAAPVKAQRSVAHDPIHPKT